MSLTSEEIKELYAFTRKHYVEWYDLQTELVDHLANGIELQMEQNSELSFKDALQTEFKKFGVFGFMDVVEERKKALGKRYLGFIKNEFLDYFKWPEFVKFLTIWGALYTAFYFTEKKYILIFGLITTFFIGIVFFMVRMRKKIKARQAESNKKWLLEQHIFDLGGFAGGVFLPIQIIAQFRIHEFFSWSVATCVLVSLGFTGYVFIIYIILVKIPSKAESYLCRVYPEYKLLKA
ncbi:hypothetical protein JM658_02370 [Joostella atrarenae]|uniref:Uncharacterized protein n=1 Tax=Joostella atrarenae TaxID=679257 RepID=A0ABS9IZP8_9FLAO|nr:hypothetical protein [Joostella atrarenae]MCF8713658.1 hypothetical protein [Joostella atrarenae]